MPAGDADRERRGYLKRTVAMLLGDGGGLCPCCVRSPWAYFHLNRALAAGGKQAADYGNEVLPSLRPLTTDAAQWDLGNWLGDGVQRGLEVAWTSDPLGLEAVASIGTGSLLIGVAIYHPLSTMSWETIVSIGTRRDTVNGPVDNRIELGLNPEGRANLTIWDDQGTPATATIDAPGVYAAGSGVPPLVLFAYIDNRPAGAQTMSLHQYEFGTMTRYSGVQSIAGLDTITGGPRSPEKALTVGHSRDIDRMTFRHYNGAIRGLSVINFGDRPPADIDSVMDQLAARGMVPGYFMEGI